MTFLSNIVKVFPSGWLKFSVLVKSEKQNYLLEANLIIDKGNGIEWAWASESRIFIHKTCCVFSGSLQVWSSLTKFVSNIITEWDTHRLAIFLQSRKMKVWNIKFDCKAALFIFDAVVEKEHCVKWLQSWICVMELSERDKPWSTHRLRILFLVVSMKNWKTSACLRTQVDACDKSRITRTLSSFAAGSQQQDLSQLIMKCSSHDRELEGR